MDWPRYPQTMASRKRKRAEHEPAATEHERVTDPGPEASFGGAAIGTVIGEVAGGAVGGPPGAVAGGLTGAVVGGMAGRAAADHVNKGSKERPRGAIRPKKAGPSPTVR
jgi:uncharacterized protein YcfJ